MRFALLGLLLLGCGSAAAGVDASTGGGGAPGGGAGGEIALIASEGGGAGAPAVGGTSSAGAAGGGATEQVAVIPQGGMESMAGAAAAEAGAGGALAGGGAGGSASGSGVGGSGGGSGGALSTPCANLPALQAGVLCTEARYGMYTCLFDAQQQPMADTEGSTWICTCRGTAHYQCEKRIGIDSVWQCSAAGC